MHSSRDVLALFVRMNEVAKRRQLTLLAAGVAFYGFFSLVPLTLLGIVVATVAGGEGLAARVTESVSGVLTPSAQSLLTDAITEESGRGGATVVGTAGLLWTGSRVLRGLDRTFAEVYGTVAATSILRSFRNAGIVAVAILVGIVAVAATEALLLAATDGVVGMVAPVFVFVFLTVLVAFLPVYVVFPNADVGLREALPGAAFAAAGWTLLGRVFGIYAGIAGTYALYGALGAVFLVLTWLYAGSVLIVLGAVLNAVLAGRDRELDRIDREDGNDPGKGTATGDRQLQSPRPRESSTEAMTDDATGVEEPVDPPAESARTRDRSGDPAALREEIARLRDELEDVEERVESRTVRKESLKAELESYVRSRVRRGHAHGWGPYLVLLYGTAMSIAAFYFLSGGWAVLTMFVVWTSTLGVYGLMVLVGTGISALGVPGRVRNRVGEWRS